MVCIEKSFLLRPPVGRFQLAGLGGFVKTLDARAPNLETRGHRLLAEPLCGQPAGLGHAVRLAKAQLDVIPDPGQLVEERLLS